MYKKSRITPCTPDDRIYNIVILHHFCGHGFVLCSRAIGTIQIHHSFQGWKAEWKWSGFFRHDTINLHVVNVRGWSFKMVQAGRCSCFFSSTQNLRHVIHQVWFCNSFAQYFLPLSTAWTSSVPSPQNQERYPSLSLNRSEKTWVLPKKGLSSQGGI